MFHNSAFSAAAYWVWNYLRTDLSQPDLLYSHCTQLLKTFWQLAIGGDGRVCSFLCQQISIVVQISFRQWYQSAVWIPLLTAFQKSTYLVTYLLSVSILTHRSTHSAVSVMLPQLWAPPPDLFSTGFRPLHTNSSNMPRHSHLCCYQTSSFRLILGKEWDGQPSNPPHLVTIVQSRRLSLFGHTARMPDEADARKILTASTPKETTRTFSYYMVEDYSTRPEIQEHLPEWNKQY